MSTPLKVGIAGATGETGTSIVSAMLASPEQFSIVALVRPASLEKPEVAALRARGVAVRAADLAGGAAELAAAVAGLDVVICTVLARGTAEQVALATACAAAGVGRFVASWFGPAAPPRGVLDMRAAKEDVFDHVRRLYLPYTMIDVGWWHQLSLPRAPSGRLDGVLPMPAELIGAGDRPMALTDVSDVGRFVARIVADPRTLNRLVFAYGEVWTQNDIWAMVARETGETIPRTSTSGEELLAIAAQAQRDLIGYSPDAFGGPWMQLVSAQYKYTLGIRGDNTPEHARYLGYLDARELYPDFEHVKLVDFVRGALQGTARMVYDGRRKV